MGRGFIIFSISGAIWILSGFVVHIILGRSLGPAEYGIFGIINAILSVCHMILCSGLKRSVAKHTAGASSGLGAIRTAGLKAQMVIAVTISGVLLLTSRPIGIWLQEPGLSRYIHYILPIIPLAGIYHLYAGFFDGCRQFGRSAIVMITFSFLKIGFVYILLAAGFEILGAIGGLIISMAGATFLAIYLGRGVSGNGFFPVKKLVDFAVPIFVFTFSTAILANVDLFMVKSILTDPAKTGYYTSAQTIARLINFSLVPFSAILLPSISRVMAGNDLALARKYILQSLRYLLMLLVLMVTSLGLCAEQIIKIIYGEPFTAGASSLAILFIGTAGLGMANAVVAIIQGSGRPKIAALIFTLLIPVDIGLNLILIPTMGIQGAALATSLTFILGMMASMVPLYRQFSVVVSGMSVLNICVAATFTALILVYTPISTKLMPLGLVVGGMVYLVALWLLKELTREDLEFVRATLHSVIKVKPEKTVFGNGVQ